MANVAILTGTVPHSWPHTGDTVDGYIWLIPDRFHHGLSIDVSNGVVKETKLKPGKWSMELCFGVATEPFQVNLEAGENPIEAILANLSGEPVAAFIKGDKGDPGPVNRLAIGNVSTSANAAKATITGQYPDQKLNLEIPKGDPGDMTQQELENSVTLFNELAVNVKRYGALGNNVADDTAAIQAAEAVAIAQGRPLYFPKGSYLFSHTMTARVVIGDHRQNTRLKYQGTTAAVGNGGEWAYHRYWERLTLVGNDVGIGLDLTTSPAGSYRNMIIEHFEIGINLVGGSSLYNVFDDVTIGSTVTGAFFDELAHESRFNNCRINFATIGFDIMGAGRTTITNSSIENCTQYGVIIRDRGPGRNVATTVSTTRFENCPVNIRVEPNVTKTMLLANHPVGGITEDLGINTTQIKTNGEILTTSTIRTTGKVVSDTVETTAVKSPLLYGATSYTDARIQVNPTGVTVDRSVAGGGVALRVNLSNAESTGTVLEVQRQNAIVARVSNSGHLGIRANSAPPTLVTGEAMFWVDTTNGAAKLMVTAKQADGAIKTGSIPLI